MRNLMLCDCMKWFPKKEMFMVGRRLKGGQIWLCKKCAIRIGWYQSNKSVERTGATVEPKK